MRGRRGVASWRRYLRFWGASAAADLDDELRFHLESRYEEFVASGMDPDEARAAAVRRVGDLASVRERCAAIESHGDRRASLMDALHTARGDVRHAVRQLRRSPSLSLAAIACFALGIGANTSIFSVVDAVLFRPLPFPEADRLVLIGEALPRFGGTNYGTISTPEYHDYQRLEGRVFERTAIYDMRSFTIVDGQAAPERVQGAVVSATLFHVLGVDVPPGLGRGFGPGDDAVDGPDVAVLSDAFWRRRFNADPTVIGRSVVLDGVSTTIIGVAPPGFVFPVPGLGDGIAEVFSPLRITADVEKMRGNSYGTRLIARLAPGVTLEQARLGASRIAGDLARRHPGAYGARHETRADVFPLHDRAVGSARGSLLLLFGAVDLVLLIACINVSSLLLARAASRQRELSVRRALGATRRRLVTQFLAEGLVLAALGGVLGVGIAAGGTRLIAASGPRSVLQGYDIGLDARVLAFAVLVTVITAIAVSLLPAFQLPDAWLARALRDEGRSASGGVARQRGRRLLVVSEIALALIVATGAGLMVKSLIATERVDPGFDPNGLATFQLGLLDYRYRTAGDVRRFEEAMIARLRTLPGVTDASAGTGMPMVDRWQIALSIEGRAMPTVPIVWNVLVFPDYFETLRIPTRAGRTFTAGDRSPTTPVAVINTIAARQLFPNENPIGRRVKWGSPTSPAPWATIVGVVETVKSASLEAPDEPGVYYAAMQADTTVVSRAMRGMSYAVRVDGDPRRVFDAIRRTVREMDPELPVNGLRPVDEIVSGSVSGRRFNTTLLAAFAGLAVALAAVGIYGLMAFTVSQRTREIGVRLAMGASPMDVFRLVVGQAARLAGTGIAIGLVGAAGVTRALGSLLFGVSPLDPLTFGVTTMSLFVIAGMAAYLPARRAARVDPQTAIRAA